MTYAKGANNACPVCGLPRGKGPHEFAHGKCMEIRAKTDGEQLLYPDNKKGFQRLKVKHSENSRRKHSAEKYKSGKLPKWMYD